MKKILPKAINTEFFEYTSHLSVQDVQREIEKLLIEKEQFLTGKYIGPHEFEIISGWEMMPLNFQNFHTKTNLRVFFFKNDKNKTQVNILVSPHSFLQLLFLLLPVFYLTILFGIESERRDIIFYGLMISLPIITSIILLSLSQFLKKRLQKKFVQYFNLDKI